MVLYITLSTFHHICSSLYAVFVIVMSEFSSHFAFFVTSEMCFHHLSVTLNQCLSPFCHLLVTFPPVSWPETIRIKDKKFDLQVAYTAIGYFMPLFPLSHMPSKFVKFVFVLWFVEFLRGSWMGKYFQVLLDMLTRGVGQVF